MSKHDSKHTLLSNASEKQPYHRYAVEWRTAVSLSDNPLFVALDDELGASGAYLWPYEALNLLAWLEQEKATLEALAKNQ